MKNSVESAQALAYNDIEKLKGTSAVQKDGC